VNNGVLVFFPWRQWNDYQQKRKKKNRKTKRQWDLDQFWNVLGPM
jgi:hypothetical protein